MKTADNAKQPKTDDPKWLRRLKAIGSKFKVTASHAYRPQRKAPSRRDRHRFTGKLRKAIELHALGRNMSTEQRNLISVAKSASNGFNAALKAFWERRGI